MASLRARLGLSSLRHLSIFRLANPDVHRKNALFYRTLHGSEVGDLFVSLIHTCELAGANAFDYSLSCSDTLRNWRPIQSAWMPWNHQKNLT
jgi:transposase